MTVAVSWSPEPAPLLVAFFFAVIYVRRWSKVRKENRHSDAPVWRLVSMLAGLATLVIAQGNPIDQLGDHLLVFHMLQHLLLLDVMPILVLFGLNRVIMRPITRRVQWLEERAGFIASPWFALIAYSGGMWIWHAPLLYNAAARHDSVHLIEHITFSAAGMLYWWHLLRPIPARRRLSALGPVVYMGVTKILLGLLGAGLTFAPGAIYEFYENQDDYWGLTPTGDQAAAGALMATEQAIIMGFAFYALFVRGLREAERKALREEKLMDRAAHERALAAHESESLKHSGLDDAALERYSRLVDEAEKA